MTADEERAARLARQLRENLKRRKAQARAATGEDRCSVDTGDTAPPRAE